MNQTTFPRSARLLDHSTGRNFNRTSATEQLASPGHTTGPHSTPLLNQHIFRSEVTHALRQIESGKARGPDNIPNELLKFGGTTMVDSIHLLFQRCQLQAETPTDWNEEFTKLLYKTGTRMNLDNYRGISLTSNVGKLFPKILAVRLSDTAEQLHWLPESQNGSRQSRRQEDQLFLLQTIIDIQKINKAPLYLAFMDVRKAFDMVD